LTTKKPKIENHVNWLAPITLAGKHITLVPLAISHCDDLIEAAKDGKLWELWYASVPSPDEMLNEIKRRLDCQSKGTMLPFTVIDNETKIPIGMTTYMDILPTNRRLEIGWTWYRKSAQKTAVNTECKLLLLTYAFETLGCNVVRLSANFFNTNSRRAIERLGAKLDGILRSHRIMRNGVSCDFCTYSILSNEWPAVKANLETRLNYELSASYPV